MLLEINHLEKVFRTRFSKEETRALQDVDFNGHENQKATGLGLYMTKQILDSLNLAISITSQVDKGTQVTIALPKE